MKAATNSAIYEGTTTHVRRKPFEHRLQYGLFSLLVDLDELDELARMPFFSHNRTNLISFFDQDHGARDGGDLREWITAKLEHVRIRRNSRPDSPAVPAPDRRIRIQPPHRVVHR